MAVQNFLADGEKSIQTFRKIEKGERGIVVHVVDTYFNFSSVYRDRDTRFDLAKSGIIGYILVSRAYGRPFLYF